MPLDYLRLPVTATVAFLLFDEVPNAWIWAGAAIIFATTYYIARRDARMRPARTDKAAARV
jgi:drug/metabolite transporter (DMT)-like permease